MVTAALMPVVILAAARLLMAVPWAAREVDRWRIRHISFSQTNRSLQGLSRCRKSVAWTLLAAAPLNVGAENATANPGNYSAPVLTLYVENDTFANADRHYTSGVKLSWLSADLGEWGQDGWRQNLVKSLPFVNRSGAHKNFGFALGQNIYTPQDTQRVPPDPNDRPYTGWTYVELTFVSKTRVLMDTLSFQLGIVGPHSYAADIQSWFHEQFDWEVPQGWDYQLEDEPGVNVVFERKTRWLTPSRDHDWGIDIVPHMGASIGNVQTYLNAGGTVRVGYNLPNDFGVDIIRPAGGGSGPLDGVDPDQRARSTLSVFLFGGVDGRAVARDIFLDGNTFEDDGPRVEKEVLVGDAYVGLGVRWRSWQFTATRVARSREFETQQGQTRFGSLSLSYSW